MYGLVILILTSPRKVNKVDEFARGYSCAVASLIRLEGCVDTNAKDLFRAGGWSINELDKAGIDRNDLNLFKKYRADLEK